MSNPGIITLSQKELQRVAVIGECVKGTTSVRRAGASVESADHVLRRFGRAPAHAEKAWRAAPRELNHICCFIHERIASSDNVVQWEGRRSQIPPQPHRFSFAGVRVQLLQSLEGRSALFYGDTKLAVENP